MQLAAIVFFVFIERFQCFRWLPKLIQFAAYNVFRTPGRQHSGVPADAVEAAWHPGGAEQDRLATQESRVAILEGTFQSAIDEQIGVT